MNHLDARTRRRIAELSAATRRRGVPRSAVGKALMTQRAKRLPEEAIAGAFIDAIILAHSEKGDLTDLSPL